MAKFIDSYVDMWKNYFNFSGRTSVAGYWQAFLINFIISFICGFLGIVGTIYGYAALIPGLAIGIRRLRDAGKHWAWIFINCIPLVGTIIYIVMLCKPSVNSDVIDV